MLRPLSKQCGGTIMISQDEIKQQRQGLALVIFLSLIAMLAYTGAEPLPLIIGTTVMLGIIYAILDRWLRHPLID
jgi:hypothetical protein